MQILLVLLLFAAPVVHPLLRPLVGFSSHLLWWVHVLPVALVTYRFGRKGAAAALTASAVLIIVGERLFGMGYGVAAEWETIVSVVTALAFTNILVVGFADYARKAHHRLHDSAFRDSLTGLANRQLLLDRLALRLRQVHRNDHTAFGVLTIDIDGLKLINEGFGHSIGDEVLVRVARRLSHLVRGGDSVARWGGDVFVVLLDRIAGPDALIRVADRVHRAVERPIDMDGHELVLSASIGATMCRDPGTTAETLLREADTAMYRAKSSGKGRTLLFDEWMHREITTRLDTERDLRRALLTHELVAHYQPIVDLASAEICGFEALVRWQHPDRGLVSPAEFIEIAESTGMIGDIDLLVLEEACRFLRAWSVKFPRLDPWTMNVNLSIPGMVRKEFVGRVRSIVRRTAVDPESIRLEITETALVQHWDVMQKVMHELRELGMQFALDDFGTGYSSLSYLQQLPVDTLKIDRSFVSGSGRESRSAEIIRTIVALARELGLQTVAEGIETDAQQQLVTSLGCGSGQGFLYARPTPEIELEDLVFPRGMKII